MATTLSSSADHQSIEISKSAQVFAFTNPPGFLAAVWTEPNAPYVRRAQSTDGGVTWTRVDPIGLTFNGAAVADNSNTIGRPLLYMGTNGTAIGGFNLLPTGAQVFGMSWNGAKWTDSIAPYTWTRIADQASFGYRRRF